MFKVKTTMDINGIGWGLKFEHGVAYTEREDLARRLRALGYEVEDMAKAKAKQPATTPTTPEAPPEQLPDDANTSAAQEKLKCLICGKECGSQAVLTRHMNKEHG